MFKPVNGFQKGFILAKFNLKRVFDVEESLLIPAACRTRSSCLSDPIIFNNLSSFCSLEKLSVNKMVMEKGEVCKTFQDFANRAEMDSTLLLVRR